MAYPVIMPKTGMAMEEGTVLRWLKREGDPVVKGEILLEIETDKTSMEVEAEASGQLLRILRQAGEVVPVTETIAWIGQPGEPLLEQGGARGTAVAAEGPAAPAAVPASPTQPAPGVGAAGPLPQAQPVPGKVPATPAARRLADRRGLALESFNGSGPYGAVRLRDLARPAPAAAQAAAGGGPERMIRSRQRLSAALLAKADVTELVETRRQLNEGQELRVSYTDLVLKAVAIALREHPEIVYHQRIDIGLAVALEDGLIVPVVRGVDGLALRQLAARTRELAARARERRLDAEETKGGTFTVSNLGMYGIASYSPPLNPPESAAIGVGAIEEVPRLGAGGRLENRKVMELCLTHDQRYIAAAHAARFLARVRLLLENPCALLAS